MKKLNIALDGPSGVGKSSAADLLAARFGMHHLDTGAMYRAIAYGLHADQIAPQENETLQKGLEALQLQVTEDSLLLNGEDVSEEIRLPQVSLWASQYAALPSVRRRLVAMQQEIAAGKGYILDGRDICDVVLPDAEVKIYLDASPDARAMRRFLQDQAKGKEVSYESVYADIVQRDLQDASRLVSPLRISDQAVVIDSSHMSLEETVEAMARLVEAAAQETEV